MSEGFGDIIYRLTKIIFYQDDINLSEQYLRC